MPLVFKENYKNALIGLWEISEEEEQLLEMIALSPSDAEMYNSFKAVQRKKEWLATRLLLSKLTAQSYKICYLPDGKPYLENSEIKISISHTKGYAAVMLHTKGNPGIDIELESRSAEKVASRILSGEELESCLENCGYSNKKLLIHWCAKEAIFKMVPDRSVSYLKQIHINLNNPLREFHHFSGEYRSDFSNLFINLFFKQYRDLLIVWGWDKTE